MAKFMPLNACGLTIWPGEKFQCIDKKHEACMYQYLGLMSDKFGVTVYMRDETHEKFMNVSFRWFSSRTIRKIGGNDFGVLYQSKQKVAQRY